MELFLEEMSPNKGPRHYFAIVDEEGDDVGIIFLELLPGNSIYIRNIQVGFPIGLVGMRAVKAAIKEEFPEVRTLIGQRITGPYKGKSRAAQWVEREL